MVTTFNLSAANNRLTAGSHWHPTLLTTLPRCNGRVRARYQSHRPLRLAILRAGSFRCWCCCSAPVAVAPFRLWCARARRSTPTQPCWRRTPPCAHPPPRRTSRCIRCGGTAPRPPLTHANAQMHIHTPTCSKPVGVPPSAFPTCVPRTGCCAFGCMLRRRELMPAWLRAPHGFSN